MFSPVEYGWTNKRIGGPRISEVRTAPMASRCRNASEAQINYVTSPLDRSILLPNGTGLSRRILLIDSGLRPTRTRSQLCMDEKNAYMHRQQLGLSALVCPPNRSGPEINKGNPIPKASPRQRRLLSNHSTILGINSTSIPPFFPSARPFNPPSPLVRGIEFLDYSDT